MFISKSAIAISATTLTVTNDRKKGVSSLPPSTSSGQAFQGESLKNFAEFQAPSDDCPANPKSKIQNPKSKILASVDRRPEVNMVQFCTEHDIKLFAYGTL
jgi:hypothetical protein